MVWQASLREHPPLGWMSACIEDFFLSPLCKVEEERKDHAKRRESCGEPHIPCIRWKQRNAFLEYQKPVLGYFVDTRPKKSTIEQKPNTGTLRGSARWILKRGSVKTYFMPLNKPSIKWYPCTRPHHPMKD